MSAIASPITADDDDRSESLFYGPDAIDIASDKSDKDQKDLSSAMRSVRTEGNLISVSPAVGNLEVTPPSYLPLMEGNAAMAKVSVPSYNELEADVENAGSLSQQKTFVGFSEPSCNYTSCLCDVNEGIRSGPSRSMTDFGKDGTIHLQRDCFVEKASGGQNHIEHITKLNMQSGDAMSPMTSRFARHPSPDLRTRALSPNAEIKVGNKRHEIICGFYAKGWCIRGNSCCFLHIKDPENKSGQQIEGELVTQNWKREVQPKEGTGDDVKRSRMPCTQVPLAATQERISRYSSEFSSNPIIQKEVSPSWHPDKSGPVSSFPSSLTHTEGMTTTQRLDMHHGYTSQFVSHSPNVNMATHLPTTCMSLSHLIPSRSGCSLSFSGSISESSIDSQQLLNSGMAYHDSRSPFSGSEREGLALNGSFGVPPHPIGCKLKFSSDDWEPSVPFKPSFFITSSGRSSVEDQKDPFDSIVEIPNIGDESLKAFILSQRSSIRSSSQVPTNGEFVEAANQGSDLHGAKISIE
ncbi:protein FRIGIDA-ESSENTIAL 1-like [Neltuma alba]|uniref:protein FRIGIDA-ESSENTIAL 1-like n=1 Tax=Neltuma alba TaxID=207710 RepID=UPI0010A51C2B|nr:protein FRIGIDA-ESSENTIAL 1-like [Prosopis alba]